jgi:hypothetical protein
MIEEVDEPEHVELAVPDDFVRGPVGLGRGGGRRCRRVPAGGLVSGRWDLEERARAADANEHDDADNVEGVGDPVGDDQLGDQRSEDQGAGAESEDREAGDRTTHVGEPLDAGGDRGHVSEPDAQASEDAVCEDTSADGLADRAGQEASGGQKNTAEDGDLFRTRLVLPSSRDDHPDREEEQRRHVGIPGLLDRPAELLHQRCAEHGPGVQDAKAQLHDQRGGNH